MIALSARQHRVAIALLCIAAALLVSLALSSIPRQLGMSAAHAQGAGSGSALVVVGSGSGSAIAPMPSTIHDPTQDPAGFLSDLELAKKHGWGVLVLVGVFGLCELLALGGKNVKALAFLGKGRVSIVIGAAVSIATTSIAALANGGTWLSVLYAAGGSALLFAHPAGTDPAKA
jgi:hypothetical protein